MHENTCCLKYPVMVVLWCVPLHCNEGRMYVSRP